MARLTNESQAAPSAQGPIETQLQDLAFLLACGCGVLALTNPGIVAGAGLAWAWHLRHQPTRWQRLLVALALLVPLSALWSYLIWGWPWRDLMATVLPKHPDPVAARLAVRSFFTETLAGPLWLEAVLFTSTIWRRRPDFQIRQDHRLDQQRWRALTGASQPEFPSLSGPRVYPTDHPPGAIRIGIDQETNRPFDLTLPADIQQHVFLPGATGTGKTTTVARFGDGALANGYGLVIIDCKGGGLRGVAQTLAHRHGVPFYLLDPDSPSSLGYNPCSGDAASVANKLIGAFSFGPTAEIYKHIAMETVPFVVRSLQAANIPVTLDVLYEALAPGGLEAHANGLPPDHELRSRLVALAARTADRTGRSGLDGLRHRLGALLEGKFAPLFRLPNPLDWETAMASPSVTYIALSTLANSEDVELMARVLAQDIKQVCARRIQAVADGVRITPVLAVWDEFAALNEAEQLVDLLLQARQALVPTIVSTQFLPESVPLRKAVLGAGLLVAHRVEGEDAEAIANQFGTRYGPELTSQVDFETGFSEKGSLRRVYRYQVHPNELRTFRTGQCAIKSVQQGRYAIVAIYPDST